MIGLALEGGGTRGSYQVGAYYALKDSHIKIDGVCGTSIGSFNAAMIAAKEQKELILFWQDLDISKLFDLEGFKDIKISTLNKTFSNVKAILKNKGLDMTKMKKTLDELLDVDKLYKSKTDFGLVTVRLNNLKPVYRYKNEMRKDKVTEYILASCSLPVFHLEKLIDDKYYVDGGFYDNSPVNLWLNKGYKKIYVVQLNGPGFKQKLHNDNNAEIIYIKPSRRLGSILSLNKERINDNIRLGYFDTLKVIKNLDGYKYCFKKRSDNYYKRLNNSVSSVTLDEIKKFYKTDDYKVLVLKALEFVMKMEKYSYFQVYNQTKVINEIKKKKLKNSIIYKYVKNLKLF